MGWRSGVHHSCRRTERTGATSPTYLGEYCTVFIALVTRFATASISLSASSVVVPGPPGQEGFAERLLNSEEQADPRNIVSPLKPVLNVTWSHVSYFCPLILPFYSWKIAARWSIQDQRMKWCIVQAYLNKTVS